MKKSQSLSVLKYLGASVLGFIVFCNTGRSSKEQIDIGWIIISALMGLGFCFWIGHVRDSKTHRRLAEKELTFSEYNRFVMAPFALIEVLYIMYVRIYG